MPRIKDFDVSPGFMQTGQFNAIIDVPRVRIGQMMLNRDVEGVSWRTGVMAIWSYAGNPLVESVYAATFLLNGYSEMTSRFVIDEWACWDFSFFLRSCLQCPCCRSPRRQPW